MQRLAHFVLATVIVLPEPSSSLAPLIKMYKTSRPDRLRQLKQRLYKMIFKKDVNLRRSFKESLKREKTPQLPKWSTLPIGGQSAEIDCAERENAPTAQVVDTSNWWSKRRNRLFCAALVLVLIGMIVAVSLALTLGKQPFPAAVGTLSNTAPTPTVDTTPSPSPVDGATPTLDFGGLLDRITLHETGIQDPIEAFTTSTLVTDGSLPPTSTRTMGEQLLDSPPQTLPPIREDPAPSSAPPDNNRRAEQQREEKSQCCISEVIDNLGNIALCLDWMLSIEFESHTLLPCSLPWFLLIYVGPPHCFQLNVVRIHFMHKYLFHA